MRLNCPIIDDTVYGNDCIQWTISCSCNFIQAMCSFVSVCLLSFQIPFLLSKRRQYLHWTSVPHFTVYKGMWLTLLMYHSNRKVIYSVVCYVLIPMNNIESNYTYIVQVTVYAKPRGSLYHDSSRDIYLNIIYVFMANGLFYRNDFLWQGWLKSM